MSKPCWMVCSADGYSGELIVREVCQRDMKSAT